MTVAASPSIFGFGGQTAKGTMATTWHRHKALRANVGPRQVVQQFPPELGGGFAPTGAFKSMAYGAGIASLHPRLEDVLGWLIYGAVGQLSGTNEIEAATVYRHVFTPPDTPTDMKWMSIREYIPGATSSDELGTFILDARAAGIKFDLAPGGLLATTHTFAGREPSIMEDIDALGTYPWTWNAEYETYESVPLAHQGSLSLGGVAQSAAGVSVTLGNSFTAPQDELIVGSPYPDDIMLLQQVLQAQWVYKWQDHSLYQSIYSGTETADGSGYIDWSPVVHTGSFELIINSPTNITGASYPYRLRIYAPTMTWQCSGPPDLIGGDWLRLTFTGTAQDDSPTFQIELDNEVSTYTWPS